MQREYKTVYPCLLIPALDKAQGEREERRCQQYYNGEISGCEFNRMLPHALDQFKFFGHRFIFETEGVETVFT